MAALKATKAKPAPKRRAMVEVVAGKFGVAMDDVKSYSHAGDNLTIVTYANKRHTMARAEINAKVIPGALAELGADGGLCVDRKQWTPGQYLRAEVNLPRVRVWLKPGDKPAELDARDFAW